MGEMSDEKKEELLENFILNNLELEQLEDEISGLNIFEAIGMKRQEIRHSATLAFLLGPKNPHGLGQHFLKKFLKNVVCDSTTDISPIDLDSADFSDVEVLCEKHRIDILIICRSANLVVAIENKIDASEHSDQLSRYSDTIDESEWKGFENKLFVFLTVDGSNPEEEKDQNTWVSYSHKDLVDILEHSLETRGQNLGSDQQVLIRHYIELMRRWILEDSKVAKLAQKIDKTHRQAIDLIIEHRSDEGGEISKLLHDKHHQISKEFSRVTSFRIRTDTSQPNILRFYVEDWERFPQMKSGDGSWVSSNNLLIIEIKRWEKLNFSIIFCIGPGLQEHREALYSQAYQHEKIIIGRRTKKVSKKFKVLSWKSILTEKKYNERFETVDEDIDKLVDDMIASSGEFLKTELKVYNDIVMKAFDCSETTD